MGGNWHINSFFLVTSVMNSGLCYYDISVWVSPALPYVIVPLTL